MEPRLKASLLWGLVGALAFLVLVQGYELLDGPGVSFLVKLAVATGVFGGATAASYVAEGWL
jgi:hypothetical protein